MNNFFISGVFWIAVAIFAFELGRFINKKTKLAILNPLLIGMVIVIASLLILNVEYTDFKAATTPISVFLAPATTVLGVAIYNKRIIIKRYFTAIIIGCFVGASVSIISVYTLCKIFKLDDIMIHTLMPKSVTTPIAISLSQQLGGMPSITVVAVLATGILGAVLSPFLIKLFKINDPIAQGIAIGTASHAIGTSKAVELGEIQGATAGIAIGAGGLITTGIVIIMSVF